MRRISFIIAILGIALLFYIMQASKPLPVKNAQDLASIKENQKVIISGRVLEAAPFGKNILLKMENNIDVICACQQQNNYKNKSLSVLGIKDSFFGENKIIALRLVNK